MISTILTVAFSRTEEDYKKGKRESGLMINAEPDNVSPKKTRHLIIDTQGIPVTNAYDHVQIPGIAIHHLEIG